MNSSINSAVKEVVKDFDVSTITTSKDFSLIDVPNWNCVSVQIDWSGFDDTDAVVKAQSRNDKSLSWVDLSGKTATMSAASGSAYFEVTDFSGADFNVNLVLNSVTEGTITIVAVFKNK